MSTTRKKGSVYLVINGQTTTFIMALHDIMKIEPLFTPRFF